MKGKRRGKGGQEKDVETTERFRVDVQFAIQRLMMERGVTQSALAEKLGMSQPRVSQFFSPKCNITIRNLSRIFSALDDHCFIWSPGLEQLASEGKVPKSSVYHLMPRLRVCPAGSENAYQWQPGVSGEPHARVELPTEDIAEDIASMPDPWGSYGAPRATEPRPRVPSSKMSDQMVSSYERSTQRCVGEPGGCR
jgi:transcriptional regulator with XRE-family HTH domain